MKAVVSEVASSLQSKSDVMAQLPIRPGAALGKYELLAKIGKGGMANIMLARQRGPAGFEKLVVLKMIHPSFAYDDRALHMLRDEALVAGRIDHPNVVHTYELGEVDGNFYIAMEYLEGESLAYILNACLEDEADLHPVLAARIVAEAAEGLHAVHELEDANGRNLEAIHRDVSPDNIVVLYNGMVKVVDFGIAKAKVPRTETQVGLLKGKYSYMSPEMIVDEPLDRRSDVFALGIVLWEALACRRLFEGDTGTTTMMQVLNAPRVPPSKWRPQVPRGLDEVVLKALEVDPGLRYQTAAELKNAIEDVIWQHRCSASHVRTFMHATFPDRMARRRHLIAQTDREELSAVDDAMLASLEEANATDSCEITTKQTTPPLQPVVRQYPRSKLRGLTLPVGVAVVLAALAGSLIAMSETRSLPAAIEHVQMSVHGR